MTSTVRLVGLSGVLTLALGLLGCSAGSGQERRGHDAATEEHDRASDDEPAEPDLEAGAATEDDSSTCANDCDARVDSSLDRGAMPEDAQAGPTVDAPQDAAISPDASAEPDAESLDTGILIDAGQPPDSAAQPDVEAPDAGPVRNVSVRFEAEVSGQPFACGQTYAAQGSTFVVATPLDFRFFVQDLRLIARDGVEVPVAMSLRAPWQTADVVLIDFEDGQGSCFAGNAETNAVITGTVPEGDYVGVAFRNGVPAGLNHANPAAAPAPMKNAPGTLWSWLLGYKFLLAELQQVTTGGQAPGLALVHVGSTACTGNPQSGSVTCANPNRNDIRLTGFDVDHNAIVADLGAIHAHTDISVETQCHSAGDGCSAPFAALGLDVGNGKPLAAQQVFSVR